MVPLKLQEHLPASALKDSLEWRVSSRFLRAPWRIFVSDHPHFMVPRLRKRIFCAKHDFEEQDPVLQSALQQAFLRFQETLRPDPLFVDPYIGCLSPHATQMDITKDSYRHCLATKFIDDKLLHMVNKIDDLRQVVLLTDGMDTRPYRLNWPASTIIFDVSPERIFRRSTKKLEEVGAKIRRSCLFYRIPSDTLDFQYHLFSKGFNGSKPCIWALQGLPIMNLADFERILQIANNLLPKGCLFLGELPIWLTETQAWIKGYDLDRLFMKHGLQLKLFNYDDVAQNLGKESAANGYTSALFVAEQLRFSDDQMWVWRREFQRIEEDGDEEGFEEL